MKKLLIFIVPFLIIGCNKDFNNRNPFDQPSNEAFWNTEADVKAALNGIYDGWFSMNNVVYFDCASDNAYNPFVWEGWQVQANGTATPGDPGASFFGYNAITRVNNFLANVDRADMNEKLRERMRAEARFFRAWNYFLKVTLYGDVPLVTEVLVATEKNNLPRDPKGKVIDFILKELEESAENLDVSYTDADKGRVTKGAALAVKARLEMFDGRFEEAVKTTTTIMGLGYRLLDNYADLFVVANENSAEVILDVQYEKDVYKNTVLGVLPPASVGGWSSINPTQSLVDAYETVSGYTIDKASDYDPKEPYQNRDPRLAATIVYPGALYAGKYLNSIDESDPTGDYYAPYGRSKTGYYPRKYVDNPVFPDIWESELNAIVIRYAEVLLTYAEAKIEANSIDQSVYDAIDMVRVRAGMPKVDKARYSNQSSLRELVRRERRVELAMEGVRWFDICRWKIGEEVMNGDVHGALLGKVDPGTGKLTLGTERIFVEKRNFNPAKNYLWPIPQSVRDATPAIDQNPLY